MSTKDSSARTSLTGSEMITNAASTTDRFVFQHSTSDHLNQANLLCSIRIRLPKIASHFLSNQLNRSPIVLPKVFTVSQFVNCRAEILSPFSSFSRSLKIAQGDDRFVR